MVYFAVEELDVESYVVLLGVAHHLLQTLDPASIPRLEAIRIDGRVVGFAAGLGLITSLVFGLIPAFRISAINLDSTLRQGGRAGTGREHRRLRDGLVVVQVALAMLLLVGAGLIGGVAQILITSSYRFGAPSMLAPFDYTSMIFAILIGWAVFSELPTLVMLVGSALVIAGGGLIIWRERQLGLAASRARARSVTDPKG